MSFTRPLYFTAVALVIAGITLELAPLGGPGAIASGAAAPRIGSRSSLVPNRAVNDEFGSTTPDAIVAANIFARSRVAPARVGAVTSHPHPARVAPRTPTFTLYGTTVGPEGAVALIDASALPHSAHMHHMGDTIAGARLVGITDSTATLVLRSGPLVLHLLPTARQVP